MMLSGRPPFEGKNELEIIKKVKTGYYDLFTRELENITPECKDFLQKLLSYDPESRLSADEALNHNWINMYDKKELDQELTI